jgi:hypothetical protein
MNWKRRPKPPAPSRESAHELIMGLFRTVATLDEIERRELGRLKGIEWNPERWRLGRALISAIIESGIDEPAQRDLVRTLRKLIYIYINYIAAIGDWRRERGLAVPLHGSTGPEGRSP